MTSRRLTLLVLLVAVFFLLPSGVQFYADWLWFGEVGYQGVYARSLATQSTLWLTTFVVAFGVLTLNLRLAFRVLTRREIVMMTPEGPRAIVVDPARLRPVVTLVSAAGAVLVASIAAAQWETWLIYWNAAPFGKADPVLGYDVGFYVFQLPFWRWLHSLAILLLALTTIGVGLVYLGAGFLRLSTHRGIQLRPPASTHAAVLAACWLAIIAAGAWLAIPEMLTAPSGLITGATYVDVHANMPAAWVLVVVAALGVLLAAYQVTQERIWPLVTAFGLCVAGVDRRGHLRGRPAALRRGAERAGARGAVHRPQHRRHARRVRARACRGARALGGRRADAARPRRQRGDAEQRAALGSPAAEGHLQPDPGDPDLLRLRLGRQRPLHDQRRVPPDHAVGARAEPRLAPEPQLDQRALHVHARLRPDAGPGQPGHA